MGFFMFKGASDQKNLDAKAPQISPEIMRVASERHQKGLMSPWVYQLLSLVRINHLLGVWERDVAQSIACPVDSVPAFEAVGRRIDPSQWTQLHFGLFSVPTSGPQLVYQRPWYVLFCLWKSAYKRSLAAYRKE